MRDSRTFAVDSASMEEGISSRSCRYLNTAPEKCDGLIVTFLDDGLGFGIMRPQLERCVDHKAALFCSIFNSFLQNCIEQTPNSIQRAVQCFKFGKGRSVIFGVVLQQRLNKQRLFTTEGVIEAPTANPGAFDKVIDRRGFVAFFPEDLHSFPTTASSSNDFSHGIAELQKERLATIIAFKPIITNYTLPLKARV